MRTQNGGKFATALTLALVCGCSDNNAPADPGGGPDASSSTADASVAPPEVDAASALVVELDVLTYNVAGLPEPLSGSQPATNTVQMSPLLNAYPLVLVQEDFAYHDDLASAATHPHQSEPSQQGSVADSLGDGLNRFSSSAFTGHQRVEWEECNGTITGANDCLTPKGFTVATHDFGGVEVDVYNLHMDAGRGDGDIEARAAQSAQLIDAIAANSAGRPLIVAGDTNMKEGDDDEVLDALMTGAGLTDACRSMSCPEPGRIDRIFVRGTADFDWEVTAWWVDASFVTPSGEPLSDHEALAATLVLRRQ